MSGVADRPSSRAPTPSGPPSLCPLRVTASRPDAAKSSGRWPADLNRVGVDRAPRRSQPRLRTRDRLHGADLVVGPHHRDQRHRLGIAGDLVVDLLRVDPAHRVDVEPDRPRRPGARRASARGRERRGARRCWRGLRGRGRSCWRLQKSPLTARLSASVPPAGEDHLTGAGAERGSDRPRGSPRPRDAPVVRRRAATRGCRPRRAPW